MVRLVALLVVGLCALAAIPARAQTGPPHFTIVVTGAAYAHVGDEVTYRYDVTVDTDRGATFVMSWPNHMVYVKSRLIEGVAEPVGTPLERWWNTYSHHAVIDVVLRMGEELVGEAWGVGAYITGTEVAEFIDSTSVYTTVYAQGTALPSTGGPLSDGSEGSSQYLTGAALALAGVALMSAGHFASSGRCSWIRVPHHERIEAISHSDSLDEYGGAG